MSKIRSLDTVSLSVLWRGLKGYGFELFRYDCMAAISVALLSVPLSMAYALAAGLPPVMGVFATIFGTIFAAAFGSSRHLIVGPTNTIAILLQAGVSQVLYTYYRDISITEQSAVAFNVMIELTLVVGLLQWLAGLFKLGRLTEFVSRSVVVGYVVGAAVAIIVSQLYALLGVSSSDKPQSIYFKIDYLVRHIKEFHFSTFCLGIGSLFFLIMANKFFKKIPAPVLMLALSSVIVIFFNLSPDEIAWQDSSEPLLAKVVIVKDYGQIPSLSPHISSPFFDIQILNTLLPIAFAIALLGILEATSIARTIAARSGQALSVNQEIFALGMTNMMVSCLGGMPCSGSFARSSLNYACGAKTRVAALLNGLFVLLLFIIFKPIVLNIPQASLAALLLFSAWRMVNLNELQLCIKATSSDAFVLLFTIFSCVIFNLEIGFYVGVILSIVFYLKQSAKLQFLECELSEDGHLKPIIETHEKKPRPVRILQVEGELFFAAADLLQTAVKTIANDPKVKVIVLQMSYAHHIDATACIVIESLNKLLRHSRRHLVVMGMTRRVWQIFCDSGLTKEIGADHLFLLNSKNKELSTKRALDFADQLAASIQCIDSEEEKGSLPSTGSHLSLIESKSTVS